MKLIINFFFCCALQLMVAQQIQSPSKEITVDFSLNSQGEPTYNVSYKGVEVVKSSKMGLTLKDGTHLNKNFSIVNSKISMFDESWSPVLGEESSIRNHYNQHSFYLKQTGSNKLLNIVFKVYNEGVAFRYEFPFENKVEYFVVSDENTEFNLTADHKTFWIPSDYDSQEYNYIETKLSQIDISKLNLENGIGLKTITNNYRVQSPLIMKSDSGLYINIFEAAVVNFPVMHLDVDIQN